MPVANASALPTPARPPLAAPTLLVLASAHAIDLATERLIWPAQSDGDFDSIARATAQIELVSHLCEIDAPGTSPGTSRFPAIETPVLDLTDQQLIELGEQLGVNWRLAFTCLHAGDAPCTACEACIRRKRAFDAARVVDALAKLVA